MNLFPTLSSHDSRAPTEGDGAISFTLGEIETQGGGHFLKVTAESGKDAHTTTTLCASVCVY